MTTEPIEATAPEPNTGALPHLLTFEEIDDAIDVLERILATRHAEEEARDPYGVGRSSSVENSNGYLEQAIGQLRTARIYRAIPEAALDAALNQLEQTPGESQEAS